MSEEKPVRHILGGKNNAALAIYLKDKVPEMEYFFLVCSSLLIEIPNNS